jgi:MFS family permease
MAVVPVALIRIPVPSETIPVKFSIAALARVAPLGVVAVVLSGFADGAIIALGAVYATGVGMEPGLVGAFMAASIIGGAASQYPLGYLSDRFSRRRVVLVVATGAVVLATVAAVVNPTGPWLFVLAAVYGSLAFPMYALAVSMINDVMPPHQLVAAAAGIIFVYAIGSIVGPIAVSVLMQIVGPVGYFWGLAMAFVPLVLYALVRIVFTARPKQRRFINLPHRSSTAAAMLAEPSKEE